MRLNKEKQRHIYPLPLFYGYDHIKFSLSSRYNRNKLEHFGNKTIIDIMYCMLYNLQFSLQKKF